MSSYLTRSFMFPELRKELEQLYNEEIKERPELDEQQIEIVGRVLTQAYQEGHEVIVRYWNDGEREVVGQVVRFDMGKVTLVTTEQTKVGIAADDIIDASLVNDPA